MLGECYFFKLWVYVEFGDVLSGYLVIEDKYYCYQIFDDCCIVIVVQGDYVCGILVYYDLDLVLIVLNNVLYVMFFWVQWCQMLVKFDDIEIFFFLVGVMVKVM